MGVGSCNEGADSDEQPVLSGSRTVSSMSGLGQPWATIPEYRILSRPKKIFGVFWCPSYDVASRNMTLIHASEGGDEHLCVLRFENLRASSSCCGDSTRVSSDPVSSASIAVDFGSLAFRKRIGPSAARPSAVDDATRPSKAA